MSSQAATATFKLYTWNTQGDFTANKKSARINHLHDGTNPVIVFVQEGGVDKGGDYKYWWAVGGVGVGSLNERCTNYILLSKPWVCDTKAWQTRDKQSQGLTLPTVKGSALVGGGQAGRTPAALALDTLLLVSWHSLAGQSNEDTSAMIQAFQLNPYYQQFDRIIVGADFNASPESVTAIVNQGSERQEKPFFAWTVASGQVTHPRSRTEIDFFLVLDKIRPGAFIANVRPFPSDHHTVGMQIP